MVKNFLRPLLSVAAFSFATMSFGVGCDLFAAKYSLGAVGGANYAQKSEAREGDTVSSYLNMAFGAQFWLGELVSVGSGSLQSEIKLGAFAGMVPIFSYTDQASGNKSSDTKIPAIIDVGVFHKSGLFFSLGGGYAYTVLRSLGLTEGTGGAGVLSAAIGFERAIMTHLSIGAGMRAMYFVQKLSSATGATINNAQGNLFPYLQVSWLW